MAEIRFSIQARNVGVFVGAVGDITGLIGSGVDLVVVVANKKRGKNGLLVPFAIKFII